MKSILVTVGGNSLDEAVFEAAHAVASPLSAHLDFAHVALSSIDPAELHPHIAFARGVALTATLQDTVTRSSHAEATARTLIAGYCAAKGIQKLAIPAPVNKVTANWPDSVINIEALLKAARTHDLTVIGQSRDQHNWSMRLRETLLMTTGRPTLIIPQSFGLTALGTVVVWWKDHGAAARAVSAALPILRAATKVIIVNVTEEDDETGQTANDLRNQLIWHGIEAATEVVEKRRHRSEINLLWAASLAEAADLIVMGGFSRPQTSELIFGGCTQAVLENAVRPVFLVH